MKILDSTAIRTIDLHTHSTASDGTLSPTGLVRLAKKAGLSAVALTDHDTCGGLSEAKRAGHEHGIEIVDGIELAAEYGAAEIHILGYFIDYEGSYFKEKLSELSRIRNERNERLLKRLSDIGLPLSEEELRKNATGSVTRLHFAVAMVEKGYVSTINSAFERYLELGKPAYVGRNTFDYAESIEIIINAGGVPVLAHPFLYKKAGAELAEMLDNLRGAGLRGIETYYPTHTKNQTSFLFKYANEHSLKITGGSDFHGGDRRNVKIGEVGVSKSVAYEILESLRG